MNQARSTEHESAMRGLVEWHIEFYIVPGELARSCYKLECKLIYPHQMATALTQTVIVSHALITR